MRKNSIETITMYKLHRVSLRGGVGHSCLLGSYISKSHSNSSLKRRINYHVIKEFANLPWKLGYPTKSFAKSLFFFLLYMCCGVCCASSLNTWFSMYMYKYRLHVTLPYLRLCIHLHFCSFWCIYHQYLEIQTWDLVLIPVLISHLCL